MPVTGIALPFLSYGGSALLTNLIAVAIVLNIGMRQKSYMFESTREVRVVKQTSKIFDKKPQIDKRKPAEE